MNLGTQSRRFYLSRLIPIGESIIANKGTIGALADFIEASQLAFDMKTGKIVWALPPPFTGGG